ncbi:hypothetical protein Ocin01_14619 [Orchesella cincta]|uniref:Uncharacterized protein n=1 Tax=Orchesella cincta TaxID=48709 RepID=A0A1D2MGP1_ORCCI|nr:hypothetical protein Ocin01_14619 [Orchesella cincta]
MDNLDFEVIDTFAKTMSKGLSSLFKLKLKRNSRGKKNSTASTISQVSTSGENSFDSFCTASPRGSVWDAKIQANDHNTMRLGLDVLA